MKRIELHIKCLNNPEDTEALREMGIDTPDKTEFRPFLVNPDSIDGCYSNLEGGCFLMINGDELTVRESYEDMKRYLT